MMPSFLLPSKMEGFVPHFPNAFAFEDLFVSEGFA